MPASTGAFSTISPKSLPSNRVDAAAPPALAAGRRSEADIAELRRSMARMRAEASDSVGFADGDLALHLAVANASGNLFMRSIGNVIEAALRASFLLSAPVETQDRETVLLWHQRIVDAIESGDAEAPPRHDRGDPQWIAPS